MAHPDDCDFGCAGTTAALTKAGSYVAYCLCTSGQAGGYDRDVPREEVPKIREREQTDAAAEVGVTDLHFLRHPDGYLQPTLELRRDIVRVIRITTPDVVLCQSPERRWDFVYASHPDHLAAGEATACAVYPDARNPFAFPELLDDEGLEPHSVPEMWVMGLEATRYVDITDTIEAKIAALRAHCSQTADFENLDEMIRNWTKGMAESGGMAQGRLAEAFRVVSTA